MLRGERLLNGLHACAYSTGRIAGHVFMMVATHRSRRRMLMPVLLAGAVPLQCLTPRLSAFTKNSRPAGDDTPSSSAQCLPARGGVRARTDS